LFQRGEEDVSLRSGTAAYGSIESIVTATGEVLPEQTVSLIAAQPGVVAETLVEIGDEVTAGAELVRFDTRLLQSAVDQAEMALSLRQIQYERLFQPATQAELRAARAAVDSARAAYNQLLKPVDQETLDSAQDQRDQAYQAYEDALDALREMESTSGASEADLTAARDRAKQAEIAAWQAELQLQLLSAGPDSNTVTAAQARVAQAQAELNRLTQGPSALEIQQAEIEIEQAELALEKAVAQLAQMTLYSPIDGVVAEIGVREGMLAASNRPAVVIVDLARLHIDVEIDEIDIIKIGVGQEVRITLDALAGKTIDGRVADIAPTSTSASGIVTYSARIDLAPTAEPLRPGMTATAAIVVERHEDVLLVPNWAIRFDRDSGQAFASVLGSDGETLSEVAIALGLRGEQFSEVTSGLQAGQTVAVSLQREALVGPDVGE
jgi:HlyD family secretion protein